MPKSFRTILRGLFLKLSYSLEGFRRLRAARSGWRLWTWRCLAAGSGLALAGTVALVGYTVLLIPFTPAIADIRKARLEQPSVLLSADGRELATFKRLNREWVPLGQVPRHVVDALIAAEDRRFYSHHGIDFRRTLAAAGYTLIGKRQGGSTITQQLARNLFPDEVGRAPTFTRKLKEAITAIKLEYAYSKSQILESYLNTVPFLYNANGIEMAARTYFNTSASRLGLNEAATLVGMLKGTAYYNPVLNPERALERRNLVLAQMVAEGSLGRERYDELRQRPIDLDFEPQKLLTGPAPHFAEQVRRWLADWAGRRGYDIYADGLIVHATVDSRLQRLANQVVERQLDALQAVAEVEWGMPSERLLSKRLSDYAQARRRVSPFRHFWQANPQLIETFARESRELSRQKIPGDLDRLLADDGFLAGLRERKTRLEAGFVALDPRSGAIRAWVGSRDFDKDNFDHVVQARRQPGSTFKPFVYAAALEEGMPSDRPFVDQAVVIRMPDGTTWRPGDMEAPSGETMTLEDGLVYSKNTITVQVMDQVGPDKVVRLARQAGVRESALDPVPSLALGTSPVTLLEMVAAYGTIAGLGDYTAPRLVTRITDRHGRVLLESRQPEGQRAFSRDTAVQLIDMLRGVVDRGTGRGVRQRFGIAADVAGKTGTTQNNTDGWFILMHPQLVAGAWVGFNDPRVRMRSDYWGQGAHNALYVVGDFYRQALASRAISPAAAFPAPERAGPLEATIDRAGNWIREILGLEKAAPPQRRRPTPKDEERDREPADSP
ncbi:MAG: multimodular transpeptidase-transglycosylase [Rhodocyclaceae bacterium]|nr:multimodular transpeptidase-transglycosylase [Rhodocyclaceae bacterium]